jgi:hypothetical protein
MAPETVLESITVVASLLPFQRITALLVKLFPVTFMVTALDPAAIVCGRTALMLGAARDSTIVVPQPSAKRQANIPMLTRLAVVIFRTHLCTMPTATRLCLREIDQVLGYLIELR